MLTGGAAPERLHIATDWPQMGQGGAELLENWLGVNPHGRLVVDFLKRVRPLASSTRNRSVYDADYEALESLQSLASEHGVAILVLHHTRNLAAVARWTSYLPLRGSQAALMASWSSSATGDVQTPTCTSRAGR